jgi:glutathione S-transferase
MRQMLELYHAEPVANSMKVLLCLKEKGLEFTSHYVDLLRFEQHQPEFVAINPNGQVPVLVHAGAIITESTVINEYLEDVFTEVALRPSDPVERARMRIWSKFVDEYFCPALSMIGWHTLVRRVARSLNKNELDEVLARIPLQEQRDKWATIAGESFTEAQLAESRRKLGVSIQRMEAILKGSPWLAGRSYSLAEVNSYSMVAGVPRLFPELMNEQLTPRAVEWLARMNERPAVKAALAMPNKVPQALRTFGGDSSVKLTEVPA